MRLQRIWQGVWLGDHAAAREKADDFDLVVNCTPDIPNYAASAEYLQLNLHPIDPIAPELLEEVCRAAATGRTLIHCHEARERSPAVMVALLMYYGVCRTTEEAVRYIHRRIDWSVSPVEHDMLQSVREFVQERRETEGHMAGSGPQGDPISDRHRKRRPLRRVVNQIRRWVRR